jgi:uncharacterized protein (DUF2062 family)
MSLPGGQKPERRRWFDRVKASVPTREELAASRWLKPVGEQILDPQLWRLNHESAARGVAIGIFWAFAVPVAQFLFAAAHSVWWRANIPVAAAVTLITNPLTVGFWLWLAYRLGSLVLDAPALVPMAEGASRLAWLAAVGRPALLGMGIFAVAGSAIGYVTVKLVWRLYVWAKRRYRRYRLSK